MGSPSGKLSAFTNHKYRHLIWIAVSLVTAAAVALSVVGFRTGLADGGGGSSNAVEGPLRAEGSKIIDANGNEVKLTGINWFGMETATYAPHGLWERNWEEMLDEMQQAGFNTLRVPYANEIFRPDSKPSEGIDYGKNPDLKGLQGLKLMDKIVTGATDRGLMVVLDRHRPTAEAQSPLWYTETVSEEQWISDWTMLAKHFKGNDLVVGADLHNEPRGQATWGDGKKETDWRLAAERAGNAVLKANPEWLIIVEGVENYENQGYWWGGNLRGAKEHPVRLADNSKLVYSAHDYGPGVFRQNWFLDKDYPNNMPALWDKHWGYLVKDGTAPVLMGEFGGRSVAKGKDLEGTWQHALMGYLKQNGMSYTYWSWNPNSGDTGGIVKDDWKTIDQAKLDMLAEYQDKQAKPKTGASA